MEKQHKSELPAPAGFLTAVMLCVPFWVLVYLLIKP